MRSLFFKVFIIFWIAQSLIFIISTALIVRRHFESPPDVLFSALTTSMQSSARDAASAYDSGGCAALRAYGNRIAQTISLQDANGQVLCPDPAFDGLAAAQPATPALATRASGVQVGQRYIWRMPVVASSGRSYTYLVSQPHVPRPHSWYRDLLRFSFPQLPVAIVIGGFTTFALVLLFTRPVVELRKAARRLATGKLDARAAWSPSQSRFFSGDEFDALMHDFNHMAERLESLVDAQKLLLRDVSHELRSPLARLSVALELARDDAGPAMTAHLERIERETERLNLLIGQLLTLSSMEAQERAENFQPVSLNRLLERMIPDAEYEANQRQCTIVFRAAEECAVRGNEELLYRAVENVVRNAIRYTADGSQVEIVLSAAEERGLRQARIDVSDRGPGIPADQLKSIFRPFHRVDAARSPGTGGFGVGLAIAERAVRLHGGELTAFNRQGGGATLRMHLPALATITSPALHPAAHA